MYSRSRHLSTDSKSSLARRFPQSLSESCTPLIFITALVPASITDAFRLNGIVIPFIIECRPRGRFILNLLSSEVFTRWQSSQASQLHLLVPPATAEAQSKQSKYPLGQSTNFCRFSYFSSHRHFCIAPPLEVSAKQDVHT